MALANPASHGLIQSCPMKKWKISAEVSSPSPQAPIDPADSRTAELSTYAKSSTVSARTT